eukprot:TRINITY_DN547_c0_g1_i1.p1 TRINITY_DN547_c0_g1~~TRINITY_DN547_c0_g1_i1.p1  ORF type:complete len:521 (-),score=147.32 TRINITY_DN547_c0_g1_i1:33-1490(-)
MADNNNNSENEKKEEKVQVKTEEKNPKVQNKSEKKKGANRAALKVPKGTRDYDPFQMRIREKVFDIIKDCFKKHGAVTIETPLFELKETLTGKYGEDSKLIYDLADQGGELCSLRYDLTVPFARYVAMNREKKIKRYQIGRVYRRDNPVMTKGRFREFYQCDFDIAGVYDVMIPDSEALKLMTEILDKLNIGSYQIKINHRKILDGFFQICGVPDEKFREISSAVDKLDKLPWEDVRKEMVEVKGLDPQVADRIKNYVSLKGKPIALLNKVREEKLFDGNAKALEALDQMQTLFSYLDAYQCLDRLLFDFSLARGLDYYTGIIYEAVLMGPEGLGVGSIAAGGRYDGLIGIFGSEDIPAVGFSVGVERVFSIIEAAQKKEKQQQSETEIFVMSPDATMIIDRMKLCNELWEAGLRAELLPKVKINMKAQFEYAEKESIPWGVIISKEDVEQGTVQLKNIEAKSKPEVVQRANLVSILKEHLKKEK